MAVDIRLPDLGEGITSGTVINIIVGPGETVGPEDAILELETDKAVLPVPAGVSGVITSFSVSEGDEIKPGEVIAVLAADASKDKPQSSNDGDSSNKSSSKVDEAVSQSKGGELIEFKLPDLGEGIAGGTVAVVLVSPGDKVKIEEAIVELETDKAVVPVPAPVDGVIKEIKVKEGGEVKIGQVVFTMEAEQTENSLSAPPQMPEEPPVSKEVTSTPTSDMVISSNDVPAGPAARKLARELGVQLGQINGSARGGRITLEDIKAFVKAKMSGPVGGRTFSGLSPLPDFSSFGDIRKEKITKLRSIISDRMSANWANIPHVHQFQDVDVTQIIALQKKYAAQFKTEGSALSVTQFLIKGLALALKEFPIFNASFDHINKEIIYKQYFNIGVAVDTPTGLIVPVLKKANEMSIFDIGKNLKELAKKTRDRKILPQDLQGASITLSNLGGIGGTHFNPIINHPEVAILGAGRSSIKPTYINGEIVPRTILPMCLAIDHRVIDGDDGARFIMFLTHYLENVEYHMMR